MNIHVTGVILWNDRQITRILNFYPHFCKTVISRNVYQIHDDKCSFLSFSTQRVKRIITSGSGWREKTRILRLSKILVKIHKFQDQWYIWSYSQRGIREYKGMSSIGAKFREKIARKSGDSSVANDAMGENGEDWHCDGCKQTWTADHKQKPDLIACCVCNTWRCQSCSKLKKSEMTAISRPDTFWSCSKCIDTMTALLTNVNAADKTSQLTMIQETIMTKLETLETKFDNKLKHTLDTEIPKAVQECVKQVTSGVDLCVQECVKQVTNEVDSCVSNSLSTVKEDMSNTVEKCLGQVQDGMTTSVEEKMSELWTEVVGKKKKLTGPAKDNTQEGTIASAVKRATLEQKYDDINREERMKNFIIYRLPESTKDTTELRKEEENAVVKKLLESLGVQESPKKITRLGRFEKKDNPTTSRPIKVEMDTIEAQNVVMDNLKKLADAPEHLKNLSISYDMTVEERSIVKEKVVEARTKTQQSKNWVYKVRGPYWNLREIRVRKENPDQ